MFTVFESPEHMLDGVRILEVEEKKSSLKTGKLSAENRLLLGKDTLGLSEEGILIKYPRLQRLGVVGHASCVKETDFGSKISCVILRT